MHCTIAATLNGWYVPLALYSVNARMLLDLAYE
jgi:hypothetical protein